MSIYLRPQILLWLHTHLQPVKARSIALTVAFPEQMCQVASTGSFTASKVDWIRAAYHIPLGCPEGPGFCPTGQRGDGRYSALAAAELLNVNVSTIADWCNAGLLESVRAHPHGPRWITLTPEIIAKLRKPTQRHWKRRRTGKPQQNVVE
jgi:hypothetical protein